MLVSFSLQPGTTWSAAPTHLSRLTDSIRFQVTVDQPSGSCLPSWTEYEHSGTRNAWRTIVWLVIQCYYGCYILSKLILWISKFLQLVRCLSKFFFSWWKILLSIITFVIIISITTFVELITVIRFFHPVKDSVFTKWIIKMDENWHLQIK